MAGPFGIQQVDVPGLLSGYERARSGSLERMYLASKRQREDAEWQRAQDERVAMRGVFRPGGGVPGAMGLPDVQPMPAQYDAPDALPSPTAALTGRGRRTTLGAAIRAGAMSAPPVAPADDLDQFMPGQVPGTLADGRPVGTAAPAASGPVALPQSEPAADGAPLLEIDPEGLARFAEVNPKMAMEIYHADAQQRATIFKNIRDHVDFESRVIAAVRAQPEERRAGAYQAIRTDLEARGVRDLPAAWDEAMADTRARLGMSALQAFQDERADRRLDADIADDEADNVRADRDVSDRITDRGERRRIAEYRATKPRASTARTAAPSPTKVLGGIMERYARGEPLSAQETEILNNYNSRGRGRRNTAPAAAAPDLPVMRSPEDARQLKPGTRFKTPDGRVMVR